MHLVDRLKDKEESALTALMSQYGDYLLRTAYLIVNDYQLAEETVQDTFITAFHKIEQLEEPEKLKSWLTTITVNRCRSHMRKWSWKNLLLHFETVERMNENESVQSPEQELLDTVWNQNLSSAIRELDYKYREVIVLFYFNELKITEIATQTKTKESTIKSRLKRGRVLLKEIIQKGEDYGEGNEATVKRPTR